MAVLVLTYNLGKVYEKAGVAMERYEALDM